MDLETRRARREEQRRTARRRHRIAGSTIGLALCVLVAVLIAGQSSGKSTSSPANSATAAGHAGGQPNGARTTSTQRTERTGPPGTQAVPILMYHVIAQPPPGAPFPGLYVPPAEFAEQMQGLKQAGWHAVTPDEVQSYWKHGTPLGSGKPIVISFDNGYHSQYTQALPVLRRLGWVGEENIQLTGLPPSQGGFGAGEIRGLLAAGWELDTQGFSHADLITLDAQQLRYQVAVSREVIQRRYRVPVNWFCYPSGHYNSTVVAAVRAAGYSGSTTVIPGWAHPADDPYRLHRLRVLGGTTADQLLSLLSGARTDAPPPESYGGA